MKNSRENIVIQSELLDIEPKREAFQIGIVYLILSILWIGLSRYFPSFNIWGFVLSATIVSSIFVYRKINKIKRVNKILMDNMEELSTSNEELAYMKDNILKNTTLIIFTWDLSGRIHSFNSYAERATGYTFDEVHGQSWIDLFLYEDEKPKVKGLIEYVKTGKSLRNTVGDRWRTKYGTDLELVWTDSPIFDEKGDVVEIISFGTNITDHKNLVRRLNNLAYFDVMTKLPNRISFKSHSIKLINRAKTNKSNLAFLYIDLDNFKQINDAIGHEPGDEFLKFLSNNLKEEIREGDYLAKLSEDEYGIILNEVTSKEDIINRIEEIQYCINQPWYFGKNEFHISASIGVSIYPEDGEDYSTLMRHANMAMYRAKELGKKEYVFYNKEMAMKVANNTFVVNQIKRAIEEKHFSLHYQPVFDMDTNELYGMEALLRWYHPERGYIPPLDYIPLIEETGQIIEVTSEILRMAFHQKKDWNEKGYKNLKIYLNISSKSLTKGGLDEEIKQLLDEYSIQPREVVLEITETSFMDNLERSLLTLKRLESIGVNIALDDFGTGYSSLSQLRALPITYVKVDQGFIRTMEKHSEEEVVVKSVIELGHSLGLKIIVEGIETEVQKEILTESNCDLGQGYFLAKPMGAQDFEEMFLEIKN